MWSNWPAIHAAFELGVLVLSIALCVLAFKHRRDKVPPADIGPRFVFWLCVLLIMISSTNIYISMEFMKDEPIEIEVSLPVAEKIEDVPVPEPQQEP